MAFSYSKLPQPPPTIEAYAPLDSTVRKFELLSIFFLIVFSAVPVIIVSMFFSGTTEMLTNHPSFIDGDALSFLFWLAISTGGFIGLRYPARWWKRIGGAVFFSLIIFALFMTLAFGTYDRFQEYRLFNKGPSTVDYEEFMITDVDRSRRENRLTDGRPLSVYVVVNNSKYRKEGRLRTDLQTYDFLLANRRELPRVDWRTRYDTGHCVKLRVEHNADAARLRIDGDITIDQLVKCPSPQSNQTTLPDWGT